MFESVKQNAELDGIKHVLSMLISVIGHATALCLVAILPLIFMNKVQQGELLTILMAPLPPPIPPAPPLPPRPAGPSGRSAVVRVNLDRPPDKIPIGIPSAPIEEFDIGGNVGSIADAAPGIEHGERGVTNAINALLPSLEPPKPPDPVRPKIREPIRRGGDVLEASLIHKVKPAYPRLAVITHVSGEVILEAIIDEEGNVTQIKVLSGHALLRDAAVDAVKKWKYRPTILNGEPIAVLGSIRVIFNIR